MHKIHPYPGYVTPPPQNMQLRIHTDQIIRLICQVFNSSEELNHLRI